MKTQLAVQFDNDTNSHCFNTEPVLWQNFHKARQRMPYGGARLLVQHGIVSDPIFIRGRFPTQQDAERTLTEAGFVKHSDSYGAYWK